MTKVKKLILTALFVAMGVVLPIAFHAVPNAGSVFLPMHIPVLLCGIICGFPFGLACGALTPALSSLLRGMPGAAYLPSMVCELAVYGLAAGILMLLRVKNQYARVYISLVGAMILGRIVYGLMYALIFRVGSYSMEIWLVTSFVTALPGIIIQVVLIPVIVIVLKKAKLIEV